MMWSWLCLFFFFNDTATTEIYTLSLHDALPISALRTASGSTSAGTPGILRASRSAKNTSLEEHTSELQSQSNIVCRLLLEKKKKLALIRALCREVVASLRLVTHVRHLPNLLSPT